MDGGSRFMGNFQSSDWCFSSHGNMEFLNCEKYGEFGRHLENENLSYCHFTVFLNMTTLSLISCDPRRFNSLDIN